MTTRADCDTWSRPCRITECRYHLFKMLREIKQRQHAQLVPINRMVESCVLDLADRGGMTLEEVAVVLGLTRERVRQIEAAAIEKFSREMRRRNGDGWNKAGRFPREKRR